MRILELRVIGLVLKFCVLSCFLAIQGFAVNLVGEELPVNLPNVSITIAPSQAPQPNGTSIQPPVVTPPLVTPISSPPPIASSTPPSSLPVPPPTSTQDPVPAVPPVLSPPAEHIVPPPSNPDVNSSAPASTPPDPNQTKPPNSNLPPTPSDPVPSVPPTTPRIPDSPGPARSVLPNEPPSLPPERDVSTPPENSRNVSPHVAPPLPEEPVASPPPPERDVSIPPENSRHLSPPVTPPLPEEPLASPPPPERDVSIPPENSRHLSPPVTPPLPEEPVASPPAQDVSIPPEVSRNVSPPVKSPLPEEPRSSPPEQNVPPVLSPPPSISSDKAPAPLPGSTDKSSSSAPVSHSPSKGPPASKSFGHSYIAPSPRAVSKSPPVFDSPKEHHHIISPAPSLHIIPPPSSIPAPPYHKKLDPKSNLSHYAPPPTSTGSSKFPFPNISPSHAPGVHFSPPSPSVHTKISPKLSPTLSPPKHPKPQPLPLWQALPPPPPPEKDCAPQTCTDPLTNGPPEYPCACVFPIQVGLSLSVALYTFFPLVSELAAEIAAGVFMKQSQVRIMGANAAEDNPEKTIVLIDLVPLGQKFDDSKALFTFQRFWQKQVLINPSIFGDYDVIYVRYPGLPPPPPLPPSTIGMVSSKPYPGQGNDPGPLKPIGVDTRGNLHRVGPSGSIMATIVLSAFVAAILLCVVAWVFLFKHRDCGNQPVLALAPAPASTIRSVGKSSGRAISTVGSGPSSPAFSLGSSIVTYSGAAKTFTSTDLEKATDNFNETQVLGEGGFGRVYSGVLEDGTNIAVKILKRDDQQGSREFLAEVEMLTRLHHRNLVKLIGICTEARTRCLVYELIPNGSVESHLHGIDKDSAPLDWSVRLKIALGSARALAYLHEDSSPRVIHRDFKASNILLENDFTPKVSDFGLARTALDEDDKHISTRVMGTFGYVAPEYAMTGHLLVKSDVYSYGVVLLELLTGRKPVDMSQPSGQENLVSWARPLLTTQEGLESMIDPILGPAFPVDSIAKVAAIASMCVQPEVSHRPFMGEVVQALKLVCNQMREVETRNSERGEDVSVDMEARSSTSSDVIDPSPGSNYDYRIDCERDVSMSELLSSSAQFDRQDSDSNRRHSSSGPISTGRSKRLWKTIGRLSGGSVSEHGVMFRLWPGSH